MDEPKNESKIESKKKGRPPGPSQAPKATPSALVIDDDEECITVRIPKKLLAKLLLKDLL